MRLNKDNLERLKNIQKKELIQYLSMFIQDDYDEYPPKTKKRIKEKIQELKIDISYIMLQFSEEQYEKECNI